MYSLDTNIFTLLYERDPKVVQKILSTPHSQIFISAIVVQESLGGRLAKINRALGDKSKDSEKRLEIAFANLLDTFNLLQQFNRLPYDADDELAFKNLSAKIKRGGASDCRIGVQAHRRNMIVVTRNVDDFEATGIRCEDWSL